MENKKWISVESSQISKISYDADVKRLFIKFKAGSTYAYEGVTQKEFDDFKSSESIGKFFYNNIKNVKQFVKTKNA